MKASEQRFRELVDLLPLTVFETDLDGNILFTNRQGFEAFGLTREGITKGLSAVQQLFSEDVEKIKHDTLNAFPDEMITGYECTALKGDGSSFSVLVYTSPIIQRGKPAGLRGAIVDNTERKLSEERLRESEERYRSLFENVPVGLYRTTPGGKILAADSALIKMLKYSSFDEVNRLDLEKDEEFSPQYSRKKPRNGLNAKDLLKGWKLTEKPGMDRPSLSVNTPRLSAVKQAK
ncbi:MAG: PAS domain-containing protein [Candidatus Odinarchaeota archaeon]